MAPNFEKPGFNIIYHLLLISGSLTQERVRMIMKKQL